MRLLHICSIGNNKMSGMSNIVPEHFIYEQEHCECSILNIGNVENDKLRNQKNVFYYKNIKNQKKWLSNYDLIVFHGIYIKEYLFISKVLRKLNIPYIIIPHGSLTENAQKIKRIKKVVSNFLLFNKFIYGSKKIQYLSNHEQEKSKAFKKQSFVKGNGINIRKYIPKQHKSKFIDLIYVGRYSIFTKGLDILLEACLIASDTMRKNNIRLFLYGGSDDGIDKLKEIVNLKKLNDIVFVNDGIYDEEKIKKITSCDYFIQTSRTEGQPVGLIEAMSLGMPIIVSQGTTFSQVAKENNCGYCGSTAEEISEIIKKLPNEINNIGKLSKNSYNYAKNNFSWDILSKEMIDIYREILRGDYK